MRMEKWQQNYLFLPKAIFFLIVLLLNYSRIANSETASFSGRFCRQQVSNQIDEIIANSEQTSRWGIIIQPQFSQEILYQRNADQFFIPASNVKLFTSAIALNQLNPNYQIITPIYTAGNPPNLDQLTMIGRGDPSLNSNQLEELAVTLKKAGVRVINQITLVTGYLATPTVNSTWEWEDVYAAYGTASNDFILDENAVTLTLRPQRVGEAVKIEWDNAIAASQWRLINQATTAPANTKYRIRLEGKLGTPLLNLSGQLPQQIQRDVWNLAIPDPNRYFRDRLLSSLAEQGINVNKVQFSPLESVSIPPKTLTNLVSPSLQAFIAEINQDSNNLYAEALLKVLIAETNEEIIAEELTELGVFPSQYQLMDGSGLSRRNLVTPSAISQLLQAMLNTKNAESFRSSLAVAGVNGTLRNRFQGTPLQGNLQGKTGTMTGISALSGYINANSDQPLVFSILLNHSQLSASQQRDKIDRILLLLLQLNSCSDPQ